MNDRNRFMEKAPMARKKKKKRGLRKSKNKPGSSEIVVLSPDQVARLSAVQTDEGSDDLPEVNQESLLKCHAYLAAHLSFPFQGAYELDTDSEDEPYHPVVVVGLVTPDEDLLDDGILCKAKEDGEINEIPLAAISVVHASKNRHLIEGYQEWFCEAEDEENAPAAPFGTRPDVPGPTFRPEDLFRFALWGSFAGGLFGFILGALLGAVELARISALVGALLLGSLGGLGSFRFGLLVRSSKRARYRGITEGVFAALICGAVGALIGAMLIAFVGILFGAIVGSLLGAMAKRGSLWTGTGFLVGSVAGPLVLAIYLDREHALFWGMHGAWMGALAGFLMVTAGLLITRGKGKTQDVA
jgi:hypothetical protein